MALDLRWATSKMRLLFTILQGFPAWLKCVVLGEGDNAVGWDESGAYELEPVKQRALRWAG